MLGVFDGAQTDPDIFDVWSTFVVASEQLADFVPGLPARHTAAERQRAQDGLQLIHDAQTLVSSITRARVPMPKSTRAFVERCQTFGRGAAALDRINPTDRTTRPHAAVGVAGLTFAEAEARSSVR